jgi:hypothetical protein
MGGVHRVRKRGGFPVIHATRPNSKGRKRGACDLGAWWNGHASRSQRFVTICSAWSPKQGGQGAGGVQPTLGAVGLVSSAFAEA